MAFTILHRAVLALCLSILAVRRVSAQSVSPTNDTSSDNNVTMFILDTALGGMETKTNISPLTAQAGMTGSLNQLQAINPKGPFVLTDTQNVGDLKAGSIAYISCEPSDYAGGNIDPSKIISLAANNKPDAIILYSVYAAQCTFNPPDGFTYYSIYTMLSANQSETVMAGLNKNNPPKPSTSISVNQNTFAGGNGSGNDNGAGGNVLGKSPTTAVAMIILYSITGIITALFLLIIIVGAIRAHRHPERYGPRRVLGRPRQSRAKGIARAMLETLPIVKFGDQEEDKPGQTRPETGRDVELAEHLDGANATEIQEVRGHAGTTSTEDSATGGPDVVTTEAHTGIMGSKEDMADTGDKTDQGLACSVCVEDFEKGQDLRVLPCKHKFHPECIDPWLLNVSGTCPLCRVELQPTASRDADAGPDEGFTNVPLANDATLEAWPQPETPNVESAHSNRRSRILHTLNHGRMRHATPEERIAALRRLRRENQTSESMTEQGGRTGNRFSRRFSHALGGSRPVSRPISDVPASATAPTFPASGDTTSSPTTTTFIHNAATPSSLTPGTFSMRMSRALGGSRPASRPISEVPASATAATFPASVETTSSPTAATFPGAVTTPSSPASGTFSRRMSRALGGSRPASRPISEVPPSAPAADFPPTTGTVTPTAEAATDSSQPIFTTPATATAAEPTPSPSVAGFSDVPRTSSPLAATAPPAANTAAPSGPPRTSWYNSWYRYRS